MERYHFNVSHGGDAWPLDGVGLALVSVPAACTAAAQMVADLTRESEGQSDGALDWQVDVTNGAGLTLFVYLSTVTLSPGLAKYPTIV
jgi:hypothetical protein